MTMREERGYQTYEADERLDNTEAEAVEETVERTTQALPTLEEVVEMPELPNTTPPEREWDGVRWTEPNVAMTDEAEAEAEEVSIYQGLYSTRIRCGDCGTSNFTVEPERTFHGSTMHGIWIAYSMLLCPTCGNGKPRLITGDKNDIGYWLLGLKKIE